MTTYADVKKQIALLEKKAADLRKSEVSKVIASIQAQMAKYDLTVADLTPGKAARKVLAAGKSVAKKVTPAKYMDPQSGKTWGGIGKPPQWISAALKSGRRDDFLIERVQAAKSAKEAPSETVHVGTKKPRQAPKAKSKSNLATGKSATTTKAKRQANGAKAVPAKKTAPKAALKTNAKPASKAKKPPVGAKKRSEVSVKTSTAKPE